MAQNDLVFAYFSVDTPMWEKEQMPSFLRGLEARKRVRSSARGGGQSFKGGGLESFGESMDAFARIIVPADPDVPGDRPAGEPGTAFFKQMIRLIQNGTVPDLGAEITEEDG